jgi:hypothetical protein
MKTTGLLLLTAFGLSSYVSHSQYTQSRMSGGQIITSKEKSQTATGTMYTSENYMPARISNSTNTVLLRYNAYQDYFEMSNPQEGKTVILPKDAGVTVKFVNSNQSYAVVDYKTEKGEAVNGYLTVISDSPNVKMYRRERVFLQPESFPGNSYQSYKPAAYKRGSDEFYIKVKDSEAVFISSKKDLAKLFPEKSKEILDFIKKNKIDLEQEESLAKLGSYLDTIL